MSFFKNLQKNLKSHHLIAIVGIVVLAFAIMQYSGRKTMFNDGFNSQVAANAEPVNSNNIALPAEAGQNEVYADVPAGSTTSTYGNNIRAPANYDPSELLPKDSNSQWAQLNPSGNGPLSNVNMLSAGFLNGIDTVGSSLRNANLQERSEPANPTVNVSPWGNTTIEADPYRKTLEIGN